MISEVREQQYKLDCQISSDHGRSSRITAQMPEKAHSHVVWCYNEHIEGKH